jgi:hypothetical protein
MWLRGRNLETTTCSECWNRYFIWAVWLRRLAAKEIRFEEIRDSETNGDQAARVWRDVRSSQLDGLRPDAARGHTFDPNRAFTSNSGQRCRQNADDGRAGTHRIDVTRKTPDFTGLALFNNPYEQRRGNDDNWKVPQHHLALQFTQLHRKPRNPFGKISLSS